jgi:hypothetical protein
MKHDMVSITTTHKYKDLEERFSYVIKVTLLPHNEANNKNGKFLGTDTLYFAVEPSRQSMKNLPKELPPTKLIKYEHNEPPNKR